ncbi:MAG TPA: M20/M25/M40 family metallo-hydrolase [Pyrinomonadaceae bacterium]|nr:M20/M25/M40 family metallo-hydrolase [Pyrinomonadaceae bacterium]
MKIQPSRRLSYLLLFVLVVGSAKFGWAQSATPVTTATLSLSERELVDSVKVDTIREVVNDLSADAMQGRGTAQPGGDKAAAYLSDRFAKLGLKPLGEKGSYLQPVKFKEVQFQPETSMKVGDHSLKLGADFYFTPPIAEKSVSGPLVFIAYGLITTTPKRNDLAGIDVRGKIVVLLDGPPKVVSKEAWKKSKIQREIIRNLIVSGAAGIIFVPQPDAEHPYSEMADYLTRRQIELADEEEAPSFLPPFINVSDATLDLLFSASGVSRQEAFAKAESDNFVPFSLKQSASITIKLKKSKGVGNNVVGLMEGSDPNLKAEALVYSAHYDAYGLSNDNRIYHGAADNALGVGEMLAVAEVLAKAPTKPRRSIIFLAVTGEEYGGYGSSYWVKNPTWKVKQVAADLNLDGMGTEVYDQVKVLVGYGAEHSSLGTVLNEVAAASGLRVIPDPMPEEKSFYRSDHYFFVKKGIPGIMILGAPDGEVKKWTDRMKQWEKTDYHQPTDTVKPDWNWDGPRTVATVSLVMGLRIANSDSMPSWVSSSVFNRERGTDKPAPPEP